MEQDFKDFVEKVKDEFKKVRAEIDSLKGSVSFFTEKLDSLTKEIKDDSWF